MITLTITDLKDNPDLSLQDKHDKMLWEDVNEKLELSTIEDFLLTSHLLKSDGNVRMLSDICTHLIGEF